MAIQYDNDGLKASKDELTSVRRIAYFALWAAFLGYAFLIAPGGDSASMSRDMSLVKQLVTSPLTTAVNPIFVTIFNLLGVVPMIFASILFPGSRDQRPPLPPFALASLAVGFFSVGPYLALREFKPYPALPQRKWLANLVESKLFASTLVLGSTFLLGFLGVSLLNDSGKTVNEYLEMFNQSKFVHVATLDLLTLGLIGVEPMREDMKRRNWYSLPKLIGFNLLPAVGPALYLLTRPKLDTDTQQQERQKEQ